MANSAVAPLPTMGFRASAACLADDRGPLPPMAAAVAMMMAIEMKLLKSAPVMASLRADR